MPRDQQGHLTDDNLNPVFDDECEICLKAKSVCTMFFGWWKIAR